MAGKSTMITSEHGESPRESIDPRAWAIVILIMVIVMLLGSMRYDLSNSSRPHHSDYQLEKRVQRPDVWIEIDHKTRPILKLNQSRIQDQPTKDEDNDDRQSNVLEPDYVTMRCKDQRQYVDRLLSLPVSDDGSMQYCNVSNLKRIWIYGERHCGTKAALGFFQMNFPHLEVEAGRLWKHDHMYEAEIDPHGETLYIFATKNPYWYLYGMQRRPYHANHMRNLPMKEFLTREWWIVSVFHNGQELIKERKRLGPCDRYENVMKMRTGKYESWLEFEKRIPCTMTVRIEDLLFYDAASEIWDELDMVGMQPKRLHHFGERQGKPRQKEQDIVSKRSYLDSFNEHTLDIIRSGINWTVEERFGYYPETKP